MKSLKDMPALLNQHVIPRNKKLLQIKSNTIIWALLFCVLSLFACLDPFMSDEKRILGDYYLYKNEADECMLVIKKRGKSGHLLIGSDVIEVIVVDSIMLIKKVRVIGSSDTSYLSFNIHDASNITPSFEGIYEAAKREMPTNKGKIIRGFK